MSQSVAGTRVPFGATDLQVSPLCVGTSSWGPAREGESGLDRDARVREYADWSLSPDAPVNFIDTSNMYGGSLSEGVIGAAILRAGGLPAHTVLQTKLDRNLETDSFSADEMWRSLHESLDRLGLERVQVLYLHDPEVIGFDASYADGGPMEALLAMKEQGLAETIGISGGPVRVLEQFVATGDFDALVTHNRFTLVDRSAEVLLSNAFALGMGITNAAPYGGGALSGRPGSKDVYGYAPTRPEVRASIDEIDELCRDAGVPLSAAALQFSMRDPRIHSTIVGASSLDRFEAALADAAVEIPESLWVEVDRHLPPASVALDS